METQKNRLIKKLEREVAALKAFEAADAIAQKFGVRDGIWAEVGLGQSTMQPRISEYRKRVVLLNNGKDIPSTNVLKVVKLIFALEEILGAEKINIKHILSEVELEDE